jgi:hypothetical protein
MPTPRVGILVLACQGVASWNPRKLQLDEWAALMAQFGEHGLSPHSS